MPIPRWRFKEIQRSDTHQEDANTQFFAQQDVAERLVREAGQNSMDAALGNQTARIVFSLTTAPLSAWSTYFQTLWPHLQAIAELRDELPPVSLPIPCLVVEDFQTSGLTGPLEPDELTPEERTHRLYWFFKNVGRTSKTGEQLGSFGIGKTVFPYSSQISTFFGYTVRGSQAGDAPAVLLGFSQLKLHKTPGSRGHVPYGYFAIQEGDEGVYEQRAVTDESYLDQFRSAFGLLRQKPQTGLSVVIPYPAAGLSRDEIARAAILQFFFPILHGQVVIEIRDQIRHDVLSAQTLESALGQFSWQPGERDSLLRQVRLAKWAIDAAPEAHINLARPSNTGQPKFDPSMFESPHGSALSQQFVAGRRLAFRVPVPVEPKGAPLLWSFVDVFLEYDRRGTAKEDLYVRKGLTLTEHIGWARQPGLCAILVAEDGPVVTMLRASENVAHTQWRRNGAAKLKHEYDRGPSKVSYILSIVRGIVEALLSPEDEADWWTLADLFPEPVTSPLAESPVSQGEESTTSRSPTEDLPTEDDDAENPEIPQGSPRQWRVARTRDGLRIQANPGWPGDFRPMRFVAAYGQLRGRKLKGHDAADFSFQEASDMVTARNATTVATSANELTITPTAADFAVEVRGFDRHRALDYRVTVDEVE